MRRWEDEKMRKRFPIHSFTHQPFHCLTFSPKSQIKVEEKVKLENDSNTNTTTNTNSPELGGRSKQSPERLLKPISRISKIGGRLPKMRAFLGKVKETVCASPQPYKQVQCLRMKRPTRRIISTRCRIRSRVIDVHNPLSRTRCQTNLIPAHNQSLPSNLALLVTVFLW